VAQSEIVIPREVDQSPAVVELDVRRIDMPNDPAGAEEVFVVK